MGKKKEEKTRNKKEVQKAPSQVDIGLQEERIREYLPLPFKIAGSPKISS